MDDGAWSGRICFRNAHPERGAFARGIRCPNGNFLVEGYREAIPPEQVSHFARVVMVTPNEFEEDPLPF